jgi:hypothetical protein
MAFTVDWTNKIVHSSASITDIPVTRNQLRDLEESAIGMLYPPIISYKQIDLGGGSIFPAIEFINGYTLQFSSGNYQVKGGNLLATINPVAGVFVDRTTSAAYAVTASGGGASPSNIWEENIEGVYTAKQIMQLLASVALGKTTIIDNGNNTATVIFRDLADTTDRLTATMEGSERTNVNVNL